MTPISGSGKTRKKGGPKAGQRCSIPKQQRRVAELKPGQGMMFGIMELDPHTGTLQEVDPGAPRRRNMPATPSTLRTQWPLAPPPDINTVTVSDIERPHDPPACYLLAKHMQGAEGLVQSPSIIRRKPRNQKRDKVLISSTAREDDSHALQRQGALKDRTTISSSRPLLGPDEVAQTQGLEGPARPQQHRAQPNSRLSFQAMNRFARDPYPLRTPSPTISDTSTLHVSLWTVSKHQPLDPASSACYTGGVMRHEKRRYGVSPVSIVRGRLEANHWPPPSCVVSGVEEDWAPPKLLADVPRHHHEKSHHEDFLSTNLSIPRSQPGFTAMISTYSSLANAFGSPLTS